MNNSDEYLDDDRQTVLIPLRIVWLARAPPGTLSMSLRDSSYYPLATGHLCCEVVRPLGQLTVLAPWFTRPPVQK